MDSSSKNESDNVNRLLKSVIESSTNIVLNIFEQGSHYQHVDTILTQNIYTTKQQDAKKTPKPATAKTFASATPLSTLFRESHHEELRGIIESWRPHLTNNDAEADVMSLNSFQFNLDEIRPVNVYLDLAHLVNHDALRAPLSVLAAYMYQHSNLSQSENALYVQLKRYKKMCE